MSPKCAPVSLMRSVTYLHIASWLEHRTPNRAPRPSFASSVAAVCPGLSATGTFTTPSRETQGSVAGSGIFVITGGRVAVSFARLGICKMGSAWAAPGAAAGAASARGTSSRGASRRAAGLDAAAHGVPLVRASLRVAVDRPVAARRLHVAAVAPVRGSRPGRGGQGPARKKKNARWGIFAAPDARTGHTRNRPLGARERTIGEGKGARCVVRVVPAVGAVRAVVRGLELEHGARVSRMRVVHQRVVAHHACEAREGGGGKRRSRKGRRFRQISDSERPASARCR